jgi:hypothetical protein
MMKFALDLADCRSDWRRDGARIVSGRSWIEPFRSPALESVFIVGPSSTLIATRERLTGRVSAPAEALPLRSSCRNLDDYASQRRETIEWPLEFLLVEVRADNQIAVTAGRFGTAPVYVLRNRQVLHGSWSLPDLYEHLTVSDLDDEGVVRFLVRKPSYSRGTVFRSVARMTERSVGVLSRSGFDIKYPLPSHRDKPRHLRPDVDAVSAFERVLQRSLRQRAQSTGDVAVEVSGGMDSAVVGLMMTETVEPWVTSCGMLVGGPAGDQQKWRRAELVEKLRGGDVTIDAMDHTPFRRLGSRRSGVPFSAEDEPYSEALTAELSAVRRMGARVVVTGIGGDELMAEPLAEGAASRRRHDVGGSLGRRGRRVLDQMKPLDVASAPASALPESCLLAAACRSPVMLRSGIWPVSPLCSPEVLTFCDWLPVRWRRGKRLFRALLARRSLSAGFLYPHRRENFAHVMEHAMIHNVRPLMRSMRRGSILADQGYLELGRLDRRGDEPAPRGLYEAVALEWSLRTLPA